MPAGTVEIRPAFVKVCTQECVEIDRNRRPTFNMSHDWNSWIRWLPIDCSVDRVLLPVSGIGDDEEGVHESYGQVRRCWHIRKSLCHDLVEIHRRPKF